MRGWRFWHWSDPVTSNVCLDIFWGNCVMKSLKHVTTRAYEFQDKTTSRNVQSSNRVQQQQKKCKKKWWKFWCWFEWIWVTAYEWVTQLRTDRFITERRP